jgi:hypothetical protein
MIELLLLCGFDTLEYSWVKATIGICMLADYSMAKKHQHLLQVMWSVQLLSWSRGGTQIPITGVTSHP